MPKSTFNNLPEEKRERILRVAAELFAQTGTGVCHCPSSNMRLGSGIAPIREYLDVQEDLLGSRSRLGRTVISRLETMQFQLLRQLRHLSKLLLAAMIILMTERGQDSKQVISRISNLASHPELDKILEPKG